VDLNLGYRFLLVGFILAVNAFFSASEVALLSVRQSRLRQLADEGQAGAQAALSLLANPERLLSVVQLGLTFAGLGLGIAGEQSVEKLLDQLVEGLVPESALTWVHAAAAAVSFLIVSYMHVVIGEVVPKNLAIETADRLAVLVAPVLLVFYRIAGPFVAVIERSASWVSRKFGLKSGAEGGSHSVEELKFMVSASRRHGLIDQFEEDAVQCLLDLRDLNAREIMVPRNAFAAAPVEADLDDLLEIFHDAKYSRIPVYERSPDNVIGIVYAKDLLDVWQRRRISRERHKPSPVFDLRRLLRQPPVVPETKPVVQLIDTFRHSRAHMALVVDEFGAVTGLLTLEDVLEQVFGEIEDEHDVKLPPLPVGWDELDLEGGTSIRDLETDYSIEVPTNAGFETLAGFILFRLGAIPSQGDSVEEGGLKFTVTHMDRNRIDRVKVEKLVPTPAAT
jgi:CBS domain containing-hemolysin-like protein